MTAIFNKNKNQKYLADRWVLKTILNLVKYPFFRQIVSADFPG